MKNRIRKAVITAAGRGTRHYPATNTVQKELFPLVDRSGVTKPTIQFVVEEALAAGIEQICIVTQPGGEAAFRNHFQGLSKQSSIYKKPGMRAISDALVEMGSRITYVPQQTSEGFGHAVYCSREWVDEEPFMLLLGDHVYLSSQTGSCSRQLINAYERFGQAVFGVQQTDAQQLPLFGTVQGGRLLEKNPSTWQVRAVYEKPDPEYARRHLHTVSLAADRFLTFFGMYLFPPTLFTILQQHIEQNLRERGEIQLTSAQAELLQRQSAIAVQVDGVRLDMGTPWGYLETQLLLARSGAWAQDLAKVFTQA